MSCPPAPNSPAQWSDRPAVIREGGETSPNPHLNTQPRGYQFTWTGLLIVYSCSDNNIPSASIVNVERERKKKWVPFRQLWQEMCLRASGRGLRLCQPSRDNEWSTLQINSCPAKMKWEGEVELLAPAGAQQQQQQQSITTSQSFCITSVITPRSNYFKYLIEWMAHPGLFAYVSCDARALIEWIMHAKW